MPKRKRLAIQAAVELLKRHYAGASGGDAQQRHHHLEQALALHTQGHWLGSIPSLVRLTAHHRACSNLSANGLPMAAMDAKHGLDLLCSDIGKLRDDNVFVLVQSELEMGDLKWWRVAG
jgi:hypothetical protein